MSTPIVIDNGACNLKIGFADDDVPKFTIPNVLGRPRALLGSDKRVEIGDEALRKSNTLTLQHPIQYGNVNNWDDMETMWNYSFEKLDVDTGNTPPVLMTESHDNPHTNKERTAQMMFENFGVPKFQLMSSAVLSLYTTGNMCGVIVECGHDTSYIVPVYEGMELPNAMQKLHIAGKQITEYLARILCEKGYDFKSVTELAMVQDIKEQYCSIALDYPLEMCTTSTEQTHALPDGQVISLTNEKFRCPEILFQPQQSGVESPGIHQLIYSSITKCDICVRKQMYNNIALSGGSSLFKGFKDRLQKEMSYLAPQALRIQVRAPPGRHHAAWVGGALMCSLPNFEDWWITKDMYEEEGSRVITARLGHV